MSIKSFKQKALNRITKIQAQKIYERKRSGWKINCTFTNRESLKTAVMMFKAEVFNPIKNRVQKKLAVVYPDGSGGETFKQYITIKKNY